MCGIAGLLNFERSFARDVAQSMADCLTHRGPDGQGIVQHNDVCFSHRRLSIIDIVGSAQPMWDHERCCLITFNGEIFNFVELKAELKERGARFVTDGDTEIILEAYKQYGVAAFARLNGQFAFALYDSRTETNYLVRDRMGEKPLYYCQRDGSLAFASEVKALELFAELGDVKLHYDYTAISDYLSLNYIPEHRTLWKEIRSLRPGCFLMVDRNTIKCNSYLSTQYESVVPFNPPEWQDMLESAIRSSIQLRLRSDVPLGIYFSGGIDSTLVSIQAFEQTQNLTAFIGSFRSRKFSEADLAVNLCKQAKIPYEVVCVEPIDEDLPDIVERISLSCDDPLGDSSAIPVFLLSRKARQHVKVVLTGDGGDELFGGYLTHRATIISSNLPTVVRKILPRLAFLCGLLPYKGAKVSVREKIERFLRNVHLSPAAAHFAWNGMFSAIEKSMLLSPHVLEEIFPERLDTFSHLGTAWFRNELKPTLHEILLADQNTYLPNDILRKVDRMSMAVGLEARPVFLDPNIVEISRNLPPELLIDKSNQRVLLKRLLRKLAPWYPSGRPKQGFSVPIHDWMARALSTIFQDLLRSKRVADSGILNLERVSLLYKQHQIGRDLRGFELWGLLILMLKLNRTALRN